MTTENHGTYDAVIVGSGHNALVTAAYLARSGWSVLVLEKNDRPGGLVRTEELTLPGFKHDVYCRPFRSTCRPSSIPPAPPRARPSCACSSWRSPSARAATPPAGSTWATAPGPKICGSSDITQSYVLRPLPAQPGHRSVVPNVYMVGAGTWPGAGVNGGSGYIVAQQLLEGA